MNHPVCLTRPTLPERVSRIAGHRPDYVERAGADAYERALRSLHITVALDATFRAAARGDTQGMTASREPAIADTVEWLLRKGHRIVLGAHNGHVQRRPITLSGAAVATMGMHLADRLGKDYLVIGNTAGTGQTLNTSADFYTGKLFTELESPRPGSLDALMAASHDEPFAADLRELSPADARSVQAASKQRFGTAYCDLDPLDAYDIIVHLPQLTPAEPDQDVLGHAPSEVQRMFSAFAAM